MDCPEEKINISTEKIMYKYFFILIFCLLQFNDACAQLKKFNNIDNILNWGFRIGLDAKNSDNQEISINGTKTESAIFKNEVGFQSAVFGRINFENLFIQPDIGYAYLREMVVVGLPQSSDQSNPQNTGLQIKTQSLSSAMLIGYNAIKEDIFLFNIYAGPNLRYDFNTKYTTNEIIFEDKNPVFGLNLLTGISANISFLHFDFRYEMNFVKSENTFNFPNTEEVSNVITIRKNENILSFSIGMMF